jgi:phosphatidylinositol-3-phosphatase
MRVGRVALLAGVLSLAACSAGGGSTVTPPPATGPASVSVAASRLPQPDHVVVVVMENHAYSDIIRGGSAPYIRGLAARGASFSRSFAVTHPSEPNYLALFSGSVQGVGDDSCPHTFSGANLGQELIAAGRTFAGFSESMPGDGYTGCSAGDYARKHNPWVNFTNIPAAANLTFARFPVDYTKLPTVSFVIPNLCDDMHDCSIAAGDTWLRNNIDPYVRWAERHNSLLILTWDEDDNSHSNQIPTIVVGADVRAGDATETINHDNVLRTIEDMYRLPAAGASAAAPPMLGIWR